MTEIAHRALRSPRDFATDMRKLIDEYRNVDTYNATDVAHRVVDRLLAEDRELLYGWLQGHAVATVATAVRSIDASSRAQARQNPASVFAAAVAEFEEFGNSEPLKSGFLQAVYVVSDAHDRKELRYMTAEEVLFVAASYEDRARANNMEATFFRVLAGKLGLHKVGDMFNNVELAELRTKVTGKPII